MYHPPRCRFFFKKKRTSNFYFHFSFSPLGLFYESNKLGSKGLGQPMLIVSNYHKIRFCNQPIVKNMYKNLLTLLLVCTIGLSLQAQDPTMTLPFITVDESDEFEIEMTVSNFTDLITMQFTIQWDPTKMSLLEIPYFNLTDLDSTRFGIVPANLDEGKLPVSWEDKDLSGTSVDDGTVIFTLRMQAMGNPGDTIALLFVEDPASIEVADITFEEIPSIVQNGQVIFENMVGIEELEQSTIQSLVNYPNPFTDFTTIEFELQETTNATLIITDLTGKEIYRNTERMTNGFHQKKIDSAIFPSFGEYIYYVQTNNNQLLEKMIFVK